jgi:pSer/pThr/pTyr-binding forkhead associated (FHA) protein
MDVGLVCDSCSAFNPMGARACARCQAALSLDGVGPDLATAPTAPPGATPAAGGATCPSCGAEVAPGHRFCGACGQPMDAAQAPAAAAPAAPSKRAGGNAAGKRTMFFGAMQASRAKLVLIKGDGLDGISFTLAGQDHLAGRVEGSLLFEEDPFLSPVHANFFYREGQLVVRDEGSANGVYLRIRGTRGVELGDRFLVGEQLLEIQATTGDEADTPPIDDGTYFFASPRRPAAFRLVQLLRGGDTGLAYRAQGDTVSIGREGNDVDFPDDPFISGHHAQVAAGDDALSLTDLGSKNGTFLRVRSEQVLQHGDYVFMGQQLLRVEIV